MNTMSNWQSRFKTLAKVEIDEVINNDCTDKEAFFLLNMFEYCAKRLTLSSARKAVFYLADFSSSQEYGITEFILTIERKRIDETNRICDDAIEEFDMYTGTFTHETNKKSIIVSGSAELFLKP